jgi:1-acyl-sn-glycerol-3-phosphate acyltransferase
MRIHSIEAPGIARVTLTLFHWYARWYMYRHLHAIRVSSLNPPKLSGMPIVVCMNHPSWWDPLVAMTLALRLFPDRNHYAPMESSSLTKFGFFERIGFFGVEPGTPKGAAKFLRVATGILNNPTACFGLRRKAPSLMYGSVPSPCGAASVILAARKGNFAVLPVAIEYVHWHERLPEALIRFGEPILVAGSAPRSPEDWTAAFGECAGMRAKRTRDLVDRARRRCLRGAGAWANGRRRHLWRMAVGAGEGEARMRTALLISSLVCAGIPALLFLVNVRRYRRAPAKAGSREYPAVSVLIPARDEELSIRAAVESVLANKGVTLECIVLDDHSSDRTAAIVRELSQHDPRLRLETAPALPPGWNGKQHACFVLSRNAKHDVLCFVDADVRLAPDALSRMLAFMNASGAPMVSGFPHQETHTWMEKLLLPLIHFVLLAFLPMGRMRSSRNRPTPPGVANS